MAHISNPRRTSKPGEPTTFLGVLARDAFKILVWIVGAFVVGTLGTLIVCMFIGLPLWVAPVGGAVASVAVTAIALLLHTSSIFDIFS